MSTGIAAVAEAYCGGRARLATAGGSFDRCRKASAELAAKLRRAGHEAVVVRLSEGLADWPDAHPKWLRLVPSPPGPRSRYWTHYAVLCEGLVVDAAFRQFDPASPHPRIVPVAQARREWASVVPWDAAAGMPLHDGPQADTASGPIGRREGENVSQTLYTRVSHGFDPSAPGTLVIAAEDLGATYGFTELGYDTADYDRPPNVFKIEAVEGRLASAGDVEAAAERVGLKLWLTKEEYLREWPGARESDWAERTYPDEAGEPNELLARPGVVEVLEAQGFSAFRDHITVGNQQPLVTVFWSPASYRLGREVEVVGDDDDAPYHVRLASEAPSPSP